MQKNTRTTSLVEAGILSAIAVVFALINLYIPFLGAFMNVFWPVPLVILGVRHGLRWSALALVTAGTIVALLVNPLQSLMLVAGLGFIGLALGWGIHKGNPPMVVLGMGSVASFASKMLVFAIGFWLMGINPLEIDADIAAQAADDVAAFYRTMGVPEAELERNSALVVNIVEIMKIVLPASIIMGSFVDTFINFWLAKKILRRLGTFVPGLPDFKDLVIPQIVLLCFGLSLIIFYFSGEQQPLAAYHRVAFNMYILCAVPVVLQGLAVGWFYIHKNNLPGFLRGLLVGSLFLTPFMVTAVVFLGMADFVLDFRRLRPQRY